MKKSELKLKAKQINKESNPSVFVMGLIFFLVGSLLMMLATSLKSPSFTVDNAQQIIDNYYKYIEAGQDQSALDYLGKYMPSNINIIIASILMFLKEVVQFGFIIFIINTVRATGAEYLNILDGFSMFFKILLMYILKSVFVTLAFLFLIIPGPIVLYALRMSRYILLDNPEYGVMECFKQSASMMKGHKWELFCLDLSFIGWDFLASLLSPVQIYSAPYKQTTYVLYYQYLAGITDFSYAEI